MKVWKFRLHEGVGMGPHEGVGMRLQEGVGMGLHGGVEVRVLTHAQLLFLVLD